MPATTPPALDSDTLASQYGFASVFFNLDPELKGILDQAVREQWTPDKFKAKFMASNWFRNNSQPYKAWQELKARDPAEAQRQIRQKALELQNLATKMGVPAGATSAQWQNWAEAELSSGMNQDEIIKSIVDGNAWGPESGGQAGVIDSRIRQIAGDYGVTISDSEIGNLTRGILQGSMTEDNVMSYAKDMAVSKYAGMKGYLDQGFTVRQVAAPYIQSYAQLLEQAPNTSQLDDPLLQKALQGTPDPKTGLPVMQSLYQFENSVRQDSRWLGTKNARDSVENVAMGVLRDWGIHA